MRNGRIGTGVGDGTVVGEGASVGVGGAVGAATDGTGVGAGRVSGVGVGCDDCSLHATALASASANRLQVAIACAWGKVRPAPVRLAIVGLTLVQLRAHDQTFSVIPDGR